MQWNLLSLKYTVAYVSNWEGLVVYVDGYLFILATFFEKWQRKFEALKQVSVNFTEVFYVRLWSDIAFSFMFIFSKFHYYYFLSIVCVKSSSHVASLGDSGDVSLQL